MGQTIIMYNTESLYSIHNFLIEKVKNQLSPSRYAHSQRVAEIAYELALKYKDNPEFAWLSGISHDYCREMSTSKILELAKQSTHPHLLGDMAEEYMHTIKTHEYTIDDGNLLYHGLAAVSAIHEDYSLPHPVYEAIATHTLGSIKYPTILQKILFVADALDPQRRYWQQYDRNTVVEEYTLTRQVLIIIELLQEIYNNSHPITDIMKKHMQDEQAP